MNSFIDRRNKRAMQSGQSSRDNAEPFDPPEPEPAPKFDGEIGDLMAGVDCHMTSYRAFADHAEQELFDMVDDRFVIGLILAATRSSDPVMRGKVAIVKPKLEELARRMLETTWKKEYAA